MISEIASDSATSVGGETSEWKPYMACKSHLASVGLRARICVGTARMFPLTVALINAVYVFINVFIKCINNLCIEGGNDDAQEEVQLEESK